MVVVEVKLGSCGNNGGLRAVKCEAAEGSILIEDEEFAVAGPVGGFKVGGGGVFDVAIGGGNGDGLKGADQGELAGGRRQLLQVDAGENGLFDGILVVCADADADVEIAFEGEPGGCAGGVQLGVAA